ncbi:MAG: DUF262 domain-containing protein [Candidatus Izemoplasmatales bacterium]|jgi:uncharacterized protein with ParB-like and HNH nuclease domain|nr:DUF262 domain-containing protein [Candidatus Izemoplasmatales bacterium]
MIFAQSNMKEFLYTPGMFFEIPEFQRPFSWQATNIDEFLNDLEECIKEGKNHYFGTVVQVKDTDSVYSRAIIDGQQRVTTSLLMISAIYHMARRNPSLIENQETTADKIEYQYLINKDLDNSRVKLRTVTMDNEILQRIFNVHGEESELDLKDRQSNVYKVYAKFREYFSKKQGGLDKYIDGLEKFEIALLTLVSSDDNPQRVFESINSTGKPLSDGDKIRNFALMLNNKKLRNHVYCEYWRPIERTLTGINQDNITDFFRYYLISQKQTNIKMPEVYSEFKKKFNKDVGETQEIDSIDKFYGNIKRALKFYQLLKLYDTNDIKNSTDLSIYGDISENIFRMRYLRVDLYIPYAMSVLEYHAGGKITDEDLASIFKLIETYFSRRIVVNFYVTSVDRFMATLHRQVLNYLRLNSEANYVEVLKYIFLSQTGQTQMPTNDDFNTAVRTFPFYEQHGNSVLCYVLSSAENGSKDDPKQTLHKIVEDELQLTIEHVMPQTLTSKEWREMLGEDYERIHGQYLHTLANLTLTGYNSEYSNLPFNGVPAKDKMTLEVKEKKTGEIRKVGFQYSPLQINKWIAARDSWNEDTLKERQDWWLENLNKKWPLPETSFKPAEEDTSIYLLDDIDLKGKGIKSIEIFGKKNSVSTWADAVDIIIEAIYDNNPDHFLTTIKNNEWLSKYIQTDATVFSSYREVYDTGYFINTGTDTNSKRQLVANIAKALNLPHDSIKAELQASANNGIEEIQD